MATANIKTPGVYINEVNGFPNSAVPIATAVPAFIGYTPKAEYQGKSYRNKAQKITSFAEFKTFYMLDDLSAPADSVKQYKPRYYLTELSEQPTAGDYMTIDDKYYSILPDANSVYYLYNSIRMFYQNGGGDAYIVSVGGYGPPGTGPIDDPAAPIVNTNVKLAELQAGLELLQLEDEPTLYICPEATLLSVDENGTLMPLMLKQAHDMQTAFCLFDVIGGRAPDPVLFNQNIETFREKTGSENLKHGASYYPFVGTTVMQSGEIDYTNLNGGEISQLKPMLSPEGTDNEAVDKIIEMIANPGDASLTTLQYHEALLNASKTYGLILDHVFKDANILPPSGGMAGIYTAIDSSSRGVWHAPANVSMVGVADLPIRLSNKQQESLNVDAVTGKSINAIRFFNGQGILVWGARTLDGNSQDWRYVSVRRTMTFLEQSIKLAARTYVFEPNDANTWAAIKSMISSFLTGIWKEGGLQGAQAADAFSVDIGLGTTMTADDLLDGFMNVSVKVSVVRPAEFIVISFQQEMAKSG